MDKNQIAAFVAAAVADGWHLSAAHEKSPVPAEQMGLLTRRLPHGAARIQIEFSSLDKPVTYTHVFLGGRQQERTYKAQHRMRGVNAKGWPFDVPATYDMVEIESRAAAANAPSDLAHF